MSKYVKLTAQQKQDYAREFLESLNSAKMSNGKITFEKSLPIIDRKATLYFTPLAWDKMKSLVDNFETEVGWHGLAKRGEDKTKDEYIVYDIMVYPQEVTGSTVTTDQKAYTLWLYAQDDETFNSMRFHGHSHVRMGVSPSGVDNDHQSGILDQLTDDMFYIFNIWNKRGEYNAKIYDLEKNVLFETSDINVKITGCDYDHDEFMKVSKELVKSKSYNYSNGYSGSYQGGYNAQSKPATQPTTPATLPSTPTTPSSTPTTTPAIPSTQQKPIEKNDKPTYSGVKVTKDQFSQKGSENGLKKKGTVVSVNSYQSNGYYEDEDDYFRYT